MIIALFGVTASMSGLSCNEQEQTSEAKLMQINGTELFVQTIGKGEPILVIHGGPGLGYHYLFEHLKPLAKDHQLIFYDQRVCGRSKMDESPETITMDNFINDIKELRKAFHIKEINILAHSWGGLLAMRYAIRYSENIKSLMLINSVAGSVEDKKIVSQYLVRRYKEDDLKLRSEIVSSKAFKNQELSAIKRLVYLGLKPQFADTAFLDSLDLGLDSNYLKTSRLLNNLSADLADYDHYTELQKINAPTLLLYGDFDPLTNVAGKHLNSSLKHSELVIIKNCGHFPFVEKKAEFLEHVNGFLNAHE